MTNAAVINEAVTNDAVINDTVTNDTVINDAVTDDDPVVGRASLAAHGADTEKRSRWQVTMAGHEVCHEGMSGGRVMRTCHEGWS